MWHGSGGLLVVVLLSDSIPSLSRIPTCCRRRRHGRWSVAPSLLQDIKSESIAIVGSFVVPPDQPKVRRSKR